MKRFLRITEEATFGTYASGGTAIYIRLDQPKAFQVMTKPEFWTIMSGSGFAVPALFGSQTSPLGATLSCPLDYAQAAQLLNWGATRINTGQTSPWTTGEIPGDLASCTIDYGWTYTDTGNLRTKRFLGCKVAQWSVACSRDQPVARLNLTIIGSTPQGNSYDSSTDPTLTVPADSVFPTSPVLFQHLKGNLTINNVARSNFQSLTIASQNTIRPYFDESRFANLIRMNGRSTTLSGSFRLKSTPDDRTAYESATPLASANTIEWNNGSHTITVNLNAQNYFNQIDENFPLDEEIYYDFAIQNLLDTVATTDFTIAVT